MFLLQILTIDSLVSTTNNPYVFLLQAEVGTSRVLVGFELGVLTHPLSGAEKLRTPCSQL